MVGNVPVQIVVEVAFSTVAALGSLTRTMGYELVERTFDGELGDIYK